MAAMMGEVGALVADSRIELVLRRKEGDMREFDVRSGEDCVGILAVKLETNADGVPAARVERAFRGRNSVGPPGAFAQAYNRLFEALAIDRVISSLTRSQFAEEFWSARLYPPDGFALYRVTYSYWEIGPERNGSERWNDEVVKYRDYPYEWVFSRLGVGVEEAPHSTAVLWKTGQQSE